MFENLKFNPCKLNFSSINNDSIKILMNRYDGSKHCKPFD